MKKEIFTKSEKFRQEYSATIVRVGELHDIENSDNLKKAMIDGFPVVVNKNDVQEGDYMIYCRNETELNKQFLSVNNMYEIGSRELNANHAEVQALIEEGKEDEAKTKVGYFAKTGRVKMIKLRGCPSMGVLMRLESFINWDPELAGVKLEDYVHYDEHGNFVPFDFDTVNDKLFLKAYVPKTNAPRSGRGHGKKKDKTKKFDRMIDGEFEFHYDTNQLQSNAWKLDPKVPVYLSVKLHGTSAIFGNILVKKSTLLNRLRDFINGFHDARIKKCEKRMRRIDKLVDRDVTTDLDREKYSMERLELEKKATRIENRKFTNFDTEYYNVYSSRTVIKNRYINKQLNSGFYSVDIWGEYNELLQGKIPENVTVYGEIVGYLTGTDRMIQKGYDYRCPKGTNKLMIYRVNEKMPDGTHREYEIDEVMEFADNLVAKYPEIAKNIMKYPLLYHGTLADLYPDIDTTMHWNENVLEAMKADKEHFGMECNEPLCDNKVPREGVCLRIANDPVKECFKLKCLKFRQLEQKRVDAGEVDIEMADNYGDENEEEA